MSAQSGKVAASTAIISMPLIYGGDMVGFVKRTAADDAKGVGASLCALVPRDDAAKRVGKPIDAGKVAGPMGTACQWNATDGEGHLQIQAVPADYWSAPTLADGYRKLSGIGQAAYVVPELGGWAAAAKGATEVIAVAITGPASTADTAVDLLKMVFERRK